jgi:hypothetical protein
MTAIVVLALIWVVGAVGPAPAMTLTPAKRLALLVRYQPVTWFATGEQFTPTNVGSFAANADLRWHNATGSFTTSAPGSTAPTLTTIAAKRNAQCARGLRTPCWMLDERNCSAANGVGPAAVACYRSDWLATSPRPVVYGRVARLASGWALQYWYFYYDEPFVPHLVAPENVSVWAQHEGDWEAITIVLNPAMTPRWVGYTQHCLGLRRSWANTARIGRHTVAYIALGSHAAWFSSGLQRIPREADCLTPAENAQLDSGHVTVYDRTSKGSVSGPPGLTGLGTYTPTSVALVSQSLPGWMLYPGTWGEKEYINVTVNGSVIRSGPHGFSPQGPEHGRRLWPHPIAVTASWPTSYTGQP